MNLHVGAHTQALRPIIVCLSRHVAFVLRSIVTNEFLIAINSCELHIGLVVD